MRSNSAWPSSGARSTEIASDASPATFDNTIVALERSGALLRRVLPVFENASAAVADDEIDALETEFAPRLAAHRDAIRLDPRLFARIETLVAAADALALDAESAYLLERRHRVAVLAGARLDDAGRAELASLNERIATLTTEFQQRLLADTNALALHITDELELSGLDVAQRGATRAAAAARGLDGWLITLVLPTGQPLLAALDDPLGTRWAARRITRTRYERRRTRHPGDAPRARPRPRPTSRAARGRQPRGRRHRRLDRRLT